MLTFSKTMHGSGKRMRGFQKTVHGPENTVQRSGEKESLSGEYEGVSRRNEVTSPQLTIVLTGAGAKGSECQLGRVSGVHCSTRVER